MHRWLLALALLTIAGCDDVSISMNQATSAASANGMSKASERQNLPRAGRYTVNVIPQFIGEAPPMSASPLAPQNYETCYPASLTPDDLFGASDSSCRGEESRAENGEVYSRMVCDFGNGPIPSELRGSYDTESAEMVGDVTYPDGTIRVTRTLKRIGDC